MKFEHRRMLTSVMVGPQGRVVWPEGRVYRVAVGQAPPAMVAHSTVVEDLTLAPGAPGGVHLFDADEYAELIRERPEPKRAPLLTEAEVIAHFGWTREQFEAAKVLGFPRQSATTGDGAHLWTLSACKDYAASMGLLQARSGRETR